MTRTLVFLGLLATVALLAASSPAQEAATKSAPAAPAAAAAPAAPAASTAPADEKPNLFRPVDHDGASWIMEINGDGEGAMWSIDDALILLTSAVTSENWHVQAFHPGLELKNGTEYVLKFAAKSPESAQILVNAQLNKDPWGELGLHQELTLTPEYKDYEYTFTPDGAEGKDNRITLVVGLTKGIVYVKNLSLMEK